MLLPIEIIDKIILWKIELNKAHEKDICTYLNSFELLIKDNIKDLYNHHLAKYIRNMKIITKIYQPEEAHHIPNCDNMLYWEYFDFENPNFKLNRDVNDIVSQQFYKRELFLHYYNKNNNINYI